jgi:hypothetical protein
LISYLTGASPAVVWNVVGLIVQVIAVGGVGALTVWLSRRWWTGLLSPLPVLIGSFAYWLRGGWYVVFESHATLWGPFGMFFATNGESAGLSVGVLALCGLMLTGLGLIRRRWLSRLVLLASCFYIGLTAQVHAYVFLLMVFVAAYGGAAYGLALKGRHRAAWWGGSVALLIVALAAGPRLGEASRLAPLALALLPALPGLALIVWRTRGWLMGALAALVALLGAAPTLADTLLGIAHGDVFLLYREASSSHLGVPIGYALLCGAVLVIALITLAVVGWQRGSALLAAVPLGAGFAWLLTTFNDRWGANQEPYRFWVDGMALLSLAALPFLVGALSSRGRLPERALYRRRGSSLTRVALTTILVGAFAVSMPDFVQFTRDYGGSVGWQTDDVAARQMRAVLAQTPGALVLTDTCIEPRIAKQEGDIGVVFYNRGIAWPEPLDAMNAVDAVRDEGGPLDADLLRAAGVDVVLTAADCDTGWNDQAAALGFTAVATDGPYTAWAVPRE